MSSSREPSDGVSNLSHSTNVVVDSLPSCGPIVYYQNSRPFYSTVTVPFIPGCGSQWYGNGPAALNSRVYVDPGARSGELQTPASEVLVCESVPAASQFTQVTLLPGRTLTCAGLKLKLRITTIDEPNASAGSSTLHPVKSGPVPVVRSEKQDNVDASNANTTETAANLLEFLIILPPAPPPSLS